MIPEAIMSATAAAANICRGEADQHRPSDLRGAEDPHRYLGDDPELALGACDQAEPVVARRVEMGAAERDHLALDRDHGDAEEIVCRHPVFETVRTA
jgi:hypothetical protein